MILINTYLLLSYFYFFKKITKNIDLRSHTITKLSLEMKDYMLDAALLDNVFQDAPMIK